MPIIKEKLNNLASKETSKWVEQARWRVANEGWLDKSAKIALKVLRTIREMHLSQKDLAEKLDVSPQQVNKLLKGQENFTLETIDKLEKALNITLIEMPYFQSILKFDPEIFIGIINYTKYSMTSETFSYSDLQNPKTEQVESEPLIYGLAS
jgi:transcriptional regulator with XRE-family HTH domain